MEITKIDRETCKMLAGEIDKALAPLAEQLGISIRAGSGTYSSTNYTVKVEVSVKGEDGKEQTREAEAFKKIATLYGFKPEDLGEKFSFNGREYTIFGWVSKSRRFPVATVRDDGKKFKMPHSHVLRLLGRDPNAVGVTLITGI